MSLTMRVLIGTALIVLCVAGAVLTSVAISARNASSETVRRGLDQSADLVAQFLAGRERTLVGGAKVFVQGPYFRTLVAERRRDDVLDQALEAADQIDADWVFITDENGVLIAKSDEVGVTGVPMGQVPLIEGALHGQVRTGFGASGDTMLFQAVAVPIRAKLGAPAGVLVAARVVDSLFLHDVKAATASDLVFYSRDEKGRAHPTASTIDASAAKLSAFLAERARIPDDSRAASSLDGIEFLSRGTALNTAGGAVVGGFLVLRSSDDARTTYATLTWPLVVALIIGALATALATWLTSRFITKPATALAASVTRASQGKVEARAQHPERIHDVGEIRDLTVAFSSLVTDLRDKEALIAAARVQKSSLYANDEALLNDADGTPRFSRTVGARSITNRTPAPRQISRPGLMHDAGALLANRYVIEGEVGRGGLGIVYRALDRVIGEVIAIKVLRSELILAEASAFEQLKLELRITRRLSHRNIVRTYDIGETESAPFLTMEFVDGASLATIIHARGSLSRAAVLAMAKQLLGALAVAHDHSIVHGDLKPQNLLIDANGLLKVTDFGVARLVRGARPMRADEPAEKSEMRAGIRLSGAVIGTPEYMAPEQLIGEPSSMQTDIYAAGIVLLECMTGSTPYHADTPASFVAHKMSADAAQLRQDARRATPVTNSDVVAIIERMIDARPELRPSSARNLLAQFSALS